MDYDLLRIDYAICGITYPDTLKVLPSAGPKTQQKFAVGDKNGVLQCLNMKDEEPVVQFKTLPGKPITSVQLASGAQSDKIFAASGNEVKGYTRKGKVFLAIETSISETITSMCIFGSDLILCSGCTVTYYKDVRELYTYICDDRVLDIAAFAAPNNARVRLLVLVANKGAVILENGQLFRRVVIPHGPSRLAVPLVHTPDIYAFYGAADGSIGLITYEESKLSSKCLVEGKGLGSVVCLGWFFNNAVHLAVGRHDGSIQLYLIDMDNIGEKPRLKYTYFCGEPVTSVAGGCVGTEESELLAATFSGRIFALRSRRLVSGAAVLSNIPPDALASRRTKLEAEIVRLEKQTAIEREKYQKSTRSLQAGLSTPPLLDIHHELSGATRDGWQEVKITSAVPLDMLFVYCIKKLDMQTDNTAVLSVCSSQGNASDLLATVRCQAGTRRLSVQMRFVLGSLVSRAESVKVLIYVLPAGAPRVARLITLRLPALPYYSQHEDVNAENEKRARCTLHVSGSFSVAEMTSWLVVALPGDMPRPSGSISFARIHTLLGTILICLYQKGSAVFKSDNISTIRIIRDIISNCSVQRSIRTEISCDIPTDSCVISFQRIETKFKLEYEKKKKIALKKAISSLDLETEVLNDEMPVLCEDYLLAWKSPSEDMVETHFDELVETVEQWYVDWRNLSGTTSDYFTETKAQLHSALCECDVDSVKQIFS